ncbi:prophage tail fiber N-terminal domain-containing protein, partial [Escherichia coli]
MSVLISGVLTDGAGLPMSGYHIILKARQNTSAVVIRTVATVVTGPTGEYAFEAQTGRYDVYLRSCIEREYCVGDISVYDDSKPGTLNDFLTALDEGDLKPDVVKRFEDLTSQAQRSADVAISATKRAEALLSEMQGIASSFPGLRFENFDDIVSRCTTAMLKLEEPEVVDASIKLNIRENIDFDYTGPVNGHCDISEPEKYKVSMYAYTTGEYFNGDANLNSDGTFYFRRCWTGAKQFRLIRIEDNEWITTLEFPLLIRSYWMPEDADPEVIRVMKDRCYTYDQALAALALMVQRHEAVERYVSGLCALVDENGGVKFFVNRLSAMSPRTYYRLGNAAWVYYALAFYLEKYPDGAQINIVREKLLSGITWLDSFLVTAPGDLREGLYKGGLGRYVNGKFDASFVAEWCALE